MANGTRRQGWEEERFRGGTDTGERPLASRLAGRRWADGQGQAVERQCESPGRDGTIAPLLWRGRRPAL